MGNLVEAESKALWKAPNRQLERVRNALESRHGTHEHWPVFDARLRAHVLDLRDELSNLYGVRGDFVIRTIIVSSPYSMKPSSFSPNG